MKIRKGGGRKSFEGKMKLARSKKFSAIFY
jgi:hypothetical protein